MEVFERPSTCSMSQTLVHFHFNLHVCISLQGQRTFLKNITCRYCYQLPKEHHICVGTKTCKVCILRIQGTEALHAFLGLKSNAQFNIGIYTTLNFESSKKLIQYFLPIKDSVPMHLCLTVDWFQ